MKYGIWSKFHNSIKDDQEFITKLIQANIRSEKRKHLKRSYVWKNLKIEFGNMGADFVYNTSTVIITGNLYKAPRIIKRVLKS
jgi:hypothetical protein